MKGKTLIITSFFLMPLFTKSFCQISGFYDQSIKSTVIIYKNNSHNSYTSLDAFGTGFFHYSYDLELKKFGLPLVTCKHLTYQDTLVLALPASDSIKQLFIRNKIKHIVIGEKEKTYYYFDGNNIFLKIPLKLDSNLFRHPNMDLALIYCRPPATLIPDNEKNPKIKLSNLSTISKSYIASSSEITPGKEIVFIGFPFGIGSMKGFSNSKEFSDIKANPVLRKGIISWRSENSNLFLIDGLSFGGNSGSPIFALPSPSGSSKFIGMVTGHLQDIQSVSYADSLGKIQATPYFVTPNNGLAFCIPAFLIYDFLTTTNKLLIEARKQKN